MNKRLNTSATPWFREPWPWLLASGPLLVIVASIISAWFALKSNDGLVSADYYREGLNVQETLSRSEKAAALALVARVRITAESMNVALATQAPEFAMPQALKVSVSHPTRAGLDQVLHLERQGDAYSGRFRLPAAGHWLILIEDDENTWRVMGSVMLPAAGAIELGDVTPVQDNN